MVEYFQCMDMVFVMGYWYWFFFVQFYLFLECLIVLDFDVFYFCCGCLMFDEEVFVEYCCCFIDLDMIYVMCEDYCVGVIIDMCFDEEDQKVGWWIMCLVQVFWGCRNGFD